MLNSDLRPSRAAGEGPPDADAGHVRTRRLYVTAKLVEKHQLDGGDEVMTLLAFTACNRARNNKPTTQSTPLNALASNQEQGNDNNNSSDNSGAVGGDGWFASKGVDPHRFVADPEEHLRGEHPCVEDPRSGRP